jgi:hypothetical protein
MDDYFITSFKQELFYHNESPEEDGSKNYVTQNQLSNQKTSLIRIDDTPSPVQGRKLTKDLKKQRSHKKSSSKKQVKKAILGVSESPNRVNKNNTIVTFINLIFQNTFLFCSRLESY